MEKKHREKGCNTGKTQGKHREFYLGWNVATLPTQPTPPSPPPLAKGIWGNTWFGLTYAWTRKLFFFISSLLHLTLHLFIKKTSLHPIKGIWDKTRFGLKYMFRQKFFLYPRLALHSFISLFISSCLLFTSLFISLFISSSQKRS